MAPVAVVTGATSGIGVEITRGLADHGYQLYVSCRTHSDGDKILKEIHTTHPGAMITYRVGLELADFDSVQHWADKLKEELICNKRQISVLVCNAGIMKAPFKLTKDQIELHMQEREFEDLLKGGKVVYTTSALYKYVRQDDLPLLRKDDREEPVPPDYYGAGDEAYAQSKMAMNRCAIGLTTVMPETTFILTSPGMVRTNITRYIADGWASSIIINTMWHGLGRLVLHSPASGAKPGIQACIDNSFKSGSYLNQKGLQELDPRCLDQTAILAALEKSDELIEAFRTPPVKSTTVTGQTN